MKTLLAFVFVALWPFASYGQSTAMYQAECFPAKKLAEQFADKGYVMSMIGITDYKQLSQLWITFDGKWKFTVRQGQETCIMAGGGYASIRVPEWKMGVEH